MKSEGFAGGAKHMPKGEYYTEREVKIFVYLYTAAGHTLEIAEQDEEGNLYQIMASLIFSAFALEAALNHIGEKTIKYWEELDRLNPIQKLKVLHTHLKLKLDISQRPAQTVIRLFKFRNSMAHGRTERLSGRVAVRKPDPHPSDILLKAQWEKYCTKKRAKRVLEDVRKTIDRLRTAAGLPKYFMHTFGSGTFHGI